MVIPPCKTLLTALILATGFHLPAMAAGEPTNVTEQLETIEKRLQQLEVDKHKLNTSMEKPYISESEPEISARLKAIESQVYASRKALGTVEGLDGIVAEAGLTMVAQGMSGKQTTAKKPSELNYRGDVTVSLPAGSIGASQGFLFTHFRMGQGLGLENPGDAFSSVNGTAFQRPGTVTSDSTVLLAQAWYQLDIPLPLGGNPDLSRHHLEFNIGKMDPFMFFDQNAIADDESRGFINQALVNNPLLDVGGDIGVDDFGFTPGMRLAWVEDTYRPEQYAVSLGVFGSGKGASYDNSLSDPFVILQAETEQRVFSGLKASYRVYYWRNGRGENIDGIITSHAGFGLSLDHAIGDYTTLFARLGKQTQGKVRFDRILTVGTEFGGSYWNRGGDALGVALGWLSISDDSKSASNALVGFDASGSEQLAEIFYRYRINSRFEISPNLQHIRQSGGNRNAPDITAYGLRLQLNY